MLTFRQTSCALACVVGTWCSPASALDITYQAVDIDDNGSAADRWRYDYILSGSLADGEAVNLLFDFATRGGLAIVTPPDDLTMVAFADQPIPAFSADGVVSLTASRAITDENVSFSVAFDNLSGGTPGAQTYQLLDATSFDVLGTGLTAAVPEPATASLMLAALALMAPVVRRQLAGKG